MRRDLKRRSQPTHDVVVDVRYRLNNVPVDSAARIRAGTADNDFAVRSFGRETLGLTDPDARR